MSWQWHPKIECDYFEEKVGVWKDVVRTVSNPRKFARKEDIPLWSFYNLVPKCDREQARDRIHLHACSANMESINALQIDYDDGSVTIAQFIDEHEGLEYALYTSPSHRTTHHKFRVVIPLRKPLMNVYLTKGNVKKYFLDMFHGCDLSTINSFRKQRMPALPLSGDDYQYRIGVGKRFDVDTAQVALLSTLMQRDRIDVAEEIDPDTEVDIFGMTLAEVDAVKELRRLMGKYAEELQILKQHSRGDGVVHYALTRIASALHMSGMGRDRMVKYFLHHDWSGKEVMDIIDWAERM